MPAHIAVIICTWNRAAVLAETLQSLARVRCPAGAAVDVLVVDNNSNDTTQALLQAQMPNWPLGRLHSLFDARQGKQFALNTGIAEARRLGCDILAFTDDDVLFPTEWLDEVLKAMDGQAVKPSLAGGRTLVTWPGGKPPTWYHPTMGAIVAEVDIGDKPLCPPPPDYSPAGTNLIARAELFDRIGPFSETHFRHMDYEFGQRALARGECVAYVPAVTVVAPVDPAILTQRYFRRWALKAGISPWTEMQPGVKHLAWVPLWLYRRALQDAIFWLFAPLRGVSEAERFARELRLWRAWGTMASRWISRLRPAAYPEWATQRSQKKKNVY